MADTYTKARLKEKGTTNYLHPETEVDQLKSSGGTALASIITTLLKAATTANARSAIEAAAATHSHSTGDITNFASQVVSAIGSQTLAALGVRYSITTNGYICFGDLFGGLILQWSARVANSPTPGNTLTISPVLELNHTIIFHTFDNKYGDASLGKTPYTGFENMNCDWVVYTSSDVDRSTGVFKYIALGF
jgi:hypothetical protein